MFTGSADAGSGLSAEEAAEPFNAPVEAVRIPTRVRRGDVAGIEDERG